MTITTGIPTIWGGVEYRSRLEARWAAFFTRIGWSHTYEPFDGAGYIPDFLIHGAHPLLVEVKPAATLKDYRAPIEKMTGGMADRWDHDLLIVGASPFPDLRSSWFGIPNAGLIGQQTGGSDWVWAAGGWIECRFCPTTTRRSESCGQTAIMHTEQWYVATPCGHYDGDQHIGHVNERLLQQQWAAACNDVKWEGR